MRTSSMLGVRSAGIAGPIAYTLAICLRACSHRALGRGFDARQRIAHRRLTFRGRRREHLDALDTDVAHRLMPFAETASDGDDWHAARPRRERHRLRQFAVQALPVDAALAGDDERRAAELSLEADRVEHELRAGDEARVEEREQSRAETTGRARARHVTDIAADEALDDVGVARQRRVELTHDLRRRALLRAEDGARAFGSEQRIGHVTRGIDRGTHETGVGLPIDAPQTSERGAAFGQVVPVSIEEPIAEGARHTRAAIVRRAAADADDDAMRARCGRREDELAGATRRGDARVALALLEEWQPARGGHLDD